MWIAIRTIKSALHTFEIYKSIQIKIAGRVHRVVSDECEDIPMKMKDEISSLNTHGTCIFIYKVLYSILFAAIFIFVFVEERMQWRLGCHCAW